MANKKWVLRGKNNRIAGERMEMKVLRKLRAFSLASCRSSGSRGLFDVWSLQGNKLRLIVAKTNGYLPQSERKALQNFMEAKPEWCQVEMHYYRSKRVLVKKILKTEEDVVPYYY